jgi:propanol-preferring alcohol dehydrogenase
MLCAAQRSTGVTVNGGYASFVSAPEAFVHKIPDGLDLVEAAPLLCAGITVFAPLRRAGNLAGKTVAVAGIGGLGHLGVRMASAMGAHVVAIVRGPGKAELARSLGAHDVIESEKEKIGRALTKMGGADIILLTGISARLFEQCIPGLGPNGTLVILAAIAEKASVLPAGLQAGQKRIVGSLVGTRDDMDAMLRFCADHGIRSMVERHPLSAVNEVLGKLRDGKVRLRAVLTPE